MRLTGKDFARVVDDISLFPSPDIAGAGLVAMKAEGGVLTASRRGVVLSYSRCPAEGDLRPVGVDYRVLKAFAPLCESSDTVDVALTKESILEIRAGARMTETQVAIMPMPVPPVIPDNAGIFQVSRNTAKTIAYLSGLAHADNSRAELACVYMTPTQLMAASQRVVAVYRHDVSGVLADGIAIPLPAAAEMDKGTSVRLTPAVAELKGENAVYYIPAAAKAQTGFPVANVAALAGSEDTGVAVCKGSDLATALTECIKCVGSLTKVEVAIDLAIQPDGTITVAASSTTRFSTRIQGEASGTAAFRLPLSEVRKVLPFIYESDSVGFRVAQYGDLHLSMADGFVVFAAWVD